MEIHHENLPILQNQEPFYKGEKDAENKSDALCGFEPVHPFGQAARRGEPLGQTRRRWSSHFSGCFGSHEHLCTNVDMEICLFGTFSPYQLYPNHSQRFKSGPDNFAPSQQIMEAVS